MRTLLIMVMLDLLLPSTAFRAPTASTLRAVAMTTRTLSSSCAPSAVAPRFFEASFDCNNESGICRRSVHNGSGKVSRLRALPALRSDGNDEKSESSDGALSSSATVGAGRQPVLSFPGGGIFFWPTAQNSDLRTEPSKMVFPPVDFADSDRLQKKWQAGAITALQERYSLSSIDSVGASAGALAATLAACDADMDLAMTLALDLCEVNEVWSRPLGLAGVWGGMVEDWLDDLLPDDAAAVCRDRVHLLVLTMWPRLGRRISISDFSDKKDLIKTCMASVHIPYFMNKKFTARHRGRRFVDGSFRASRKTLSLGPDRPTVYIDYKHDTVMAKREGKFLSLTNRDGLLYMRERGYKHVQDMLAQGELDCLEGVRLSQFVPRRQAVGESVPQEPEDGAA